tara:strand:- start:145 stop:405 length:261 start_codon:yes stop_codon:yes gene_type:complete
MAYEEWSQEEINEYVQVENEGLSDLYEKAGIPTSDPEARAKHLLENFLDLTMTDEDLVMSKAKIDGKLAALNLLEELAAIDLDLLT